MILKVLSAQVCGPNSLNVRFNDGSERRVNLLPLLEGPMFVRLRDPATFSLVRLNPVTGTVEWPNGADLAPEALRDLPDERTRERKSASSS